MRTSPCCSCSLPFMVPCQISGDWGGGGHVPLRSFPTHVGWVVAGAWLWLGARESPGEASGAQTGGDPERGGVSWPKRDRRSREGRTGLKLPFSGREGLGRRCSAQAAESERGPEIPWLCRRPSNWKAAGATGPPFPLVQSGEGGGSGAFGGEGGCSTEARRKQGPTSSRNPGDLP